MSVCFTDKHIYVQFIDDLVGRTLASMSTIAAEAKGTKANLAGAKKLGALAAQKAKERNITEIVFDRGGFKYHGRVKALADAAREAGLKF
jgi:large subunit ribosomal protein L18